MAVIQRADGTQLVIRCYRETLSLSNTTLFKQHAFLISEMHGYFAKFLPARSGKKIESVFSTDAGFLLAEMIWYHFGRPANMIFCEKLNEEQYITIIVRDELVYTDGNLTTNELREELAAASINMQSASIYLFGDIPGFFASNDPNADTPLLSFNQKNITRLATSLFNEIVPAAEFELVPIQQAISDLQLSKASKRNAITLLVVLVILIVGGGAYYFLSRPVTVEQQIDPLKDFTSALSSPSPQAILDQVVAEIAVLNGIAGWQIGSIDIKANSIIANAHSYGGSAQQLLSWAKNQKATLKFTNSGADIALTMPNTTPRIPPATPPALQANTAKLIDIVIKLSLDKSISLGMITSKGAYSILPVKINLQNASPVTLLLFGQFLNTLPITIDSISLKNSDLIDGDIDLTLYGN